MNFRTLLLIISLVILLASGSAYVVFVIVGGPFDRGDLEASGRGELPGPMYDVGTLTVNLQNDGAPGVRYVRTGVVLELDSQKTARELERREPQIVDRIIAVLREQTVESISGSEGQEKLRTQLLASVNEVLAEGEVLQVWFTDLVVQ